MSQAQPTDKKKWWYACRLFRTNSLKKGAVWRIDPLLGKDLETSNKTTAIAMQQHGKHACMTIEVLLEMICNRLLGTCDSWTATLEKGVFSMWSVLRSYLEGN
jgi:hypothetical protein